MDIPDRWESNKMNKLFVVLVAEGATTAQGYTWYFQHRIQFPPLSQPRAILKSTGLLTHCTQKRFGFELFPFVKCDAAQEYSRGKAKCRPRYQSSKCIPTSTR